MLAKKPEDRYQTAADLLKDLERVIHGQSTSPVGTTPTTPEGASTAGTIRITCGGCDQPLKPRRKFIGTQVRCPTCKNFLLVPAQEGVVMPAAPPTVPPQQSPPLAPRPRDTIDPRPGIGHARDQADEEAATLSKPIVLSVAFVILALGQGYFIVNQFWRPSGSPRTTETEPTPMFTEPANQPP